MKKTFVLLTLLVLTLFALRKPARPLVATLGRAVAPALTATHAVTALIPGLPAQTTAPGRLVQTAILADRALDQSLGHEARWQAVFGLGERRPVDAAALARVAVAKFDASDRRAPFEIRVRTQALVALDRVAAEGARVTDELNLCATAQPEENLRMFATIALAGIEQGRPGKLNRYFDVLLTQDKR